MSRGQKQLEINNFFISQPIFKCNQWRNNHITKVDKVHGLPKSQGPPGFLTNKIYCDFSDCLLVE